jgi:hypothetical protein
MDTTLKNSQSNSSHSCGSYEHSENSRFYRTLDYYSKIVNGILYLKQKSKPPETSTKD